MRVRVGRFDTQRPSARLPALISLGLLALGGCHSGAPAERWVRVSRSSIPLSEVRVHARIDIAVKAPSDLSILKVTVRLPLGAHQHGIRAVADTPLRHIGGEGGDRPSLYWSGRAGGEITPGTYGRFPVQFRATGAETGDTLFFPVEVLMGDSSIVEWNGLPGSEWPAPMVVVGRPMPRVERKPALVASALAVLVLLVAGFYKIRQRGSR